MRRRAGRSASTGGASCSARWSRADFPRWSEVPPAQRGLAAQVGATTHPGRARPGPRPRGVPLRAATPATGSASSASRFAFGLFVDGAFAGEVNLNNVAPRPVPDGLRRLLDRRGAGRASYIPEGRRRGAAVRLRGPAAAPARDLHHPAQRQQPAGDGEAGRSGRRASPCATSRSTACGRTTCATASPPRSGGNAATPLGSVWL